MVENGVPPDVENGDVLPDVHPAAGSLDKGSGEQAPSKPTVIKLDNGEEVSPSQLGLPRELCQVIDDLAAGEDHAVTCAYLRKRTTLSKELAKHLNSEENDDVIEHIALLGRLIHHRDNDHPEIEYRHMPLKFRQLMEKWDEDKSGSVDFAELEAAALAQEAMKDRMSLMRKGIIFLAGLVVLLMVGMFAISYAAIEMTKESHVTDSGGGALMTSTSGDTVQVGNDAFSGGTGGMLVSRETQVCSDPDAGGCRRLTAAASVPVQVASAKTGLDGLTSALPDASFDELLQLVLADPTKDNHTLLLKVSSWQRVAARSSTCGSIVHLNFADGIGRLTLDDRALSVNPTLEHHLNQTGFGWLFSGEGGGLGRRLSSTDGMLKGFFNLLRGVEQTCMPVQLEPPEDLLNEFRAEIHVRVKVAGHPETGLSDFFFDESGSALPKPGYELEYDGCTGKVVEAYRTWQERMLSGAGLEVVQARAQMQPFLKQVKVQRGGAQLSLVEQGGTGYRCVVSGDDDGEGGRRLDEGPRLKYMGLAEEDGLLLRHFRLYLVEEQEHYIRQRRLQGPITEEDANSTQNMMAMIKAGALPTHMDYYDVDSDPSGIRNSGDPYRIVHASSVNGSRVFQEKTYVTLEPLEVDDLNASVALDLLGVTELHAACAFAPNQTVTSDMEDLLAEVSAYPPVVNGSFQALPQFDPANELGSSILFSYDRLVEAEMARIRGLDDFDEEAHAFAEDAPAWRAALLQDPASFRSELEGRDSALQQENESDRRLERRPEEKIGTGALARRLAAERRERQEAALESLEKNGSSFVLGGRRLGAADLRRLGSGGGSKGWGFDLSLTDDGGYALSMELTFGIAGLVLEIELDGTFKVVNGFGEGFGTVTMWSPPTVELSFFGDLGFEPGGGFGGAIGMQSNIGFYGIGFGQGGLLGLNMDWQGRLSSLMADQWMNMGKFYFGGVVELAPAGCGSRYFHRWRMSYAAYFGRSSRFKRMRFHWDLNIFSFEIGGSSGCR